MHFYLVGKLYIDFTKLLSGQFQPVESTQIVHLSSVSKLICQPPKQHALWSAPKPVTKSRRKVEIYQNKNTVKTVIL